MALQRLEHSARVVLYISGSLVGCVTNFTYTSNTNRSPIRGIDLLTLQDIGPSTVEISGTINLLRPIGIGGAQGIGLVAQSPDIPYEKYVTLLMLDLVTDQTVFKADYCTVTSETWNVPLKSLITGSISFIGIAYTNEQSSSS